MNLLQRQILTHKNKYQIFDHHHKIIKSPPCDVFINHRGTDTKRTVASLLYDHLYQLKLCPFLDNKNMKPGDKLFEKIDAAITGCKIGVAPSELRVVDDGSMKREEVERFNLALEEAKYTVGLAFDSQKGNWSDVVRNISDIVIESLEEVDQEDYEAKNAIS
ncbi:hypothetical protein DH2020_011661 [Rehmannia glutinosa]|uniref:TIR domain-containing protein n=1 Tax=Rehmannia glutinosa TaxID=99300 RepID=A0ABR0XDZ9_REHGL